MKPEEVKAIEAYLKRTLNPKITLSARPRVTDSVELAVDGEHIAVVYRIEDEVLLVLVVSVGDRGGVYERLRRKR